MKFYSVGFFAALLVWITLWPQSNKSQSSPQPDNQELQQLFADDQHDRGADPFSDKEKPAKGWKDLPWDEINKHDLARQARVHEMLNSGTVRTGNDYIWASLIFQHGRTSNDYLLAHVLAMAAVSKGEKGGRWIAAATLDRYLHSMKQAQVFGTQFVPIQKAKGLNQGEYNHDLLSDSVRAAMCVTPYTKQADQAKQAEKNPDEADFNTGLLPCP
ncbi:MAG: hypothetical protein DMG65_06900 [Candidatus Angelobacter sp. Gp1-AA117]|nr:MAG: hypothetical protein DMG65_06900 [Candidatus Angelobacter sp. Gp1-AA117]